MVQNTGYEIRVISAYSGVNHKEADEWARKFEGKYGVSIHFPIEDSSIGSRHRHDEKIIRIPKRNLCLLEEVIDLLNRNKYQIKGIQIKKRGEILKK